jgi:hypothetical protein
MARQNKGTKLNVKWATGVSMETSNSGFLNRYVGPAVRNVVSAISFYIIMKASASFILVMLTRL